MYTHDEREPDHATSATGHVIEELELYGYRPSEDEPDPRITPEDHIIQSAVADIFDALISTMADTSLDFDLAEILWSSVNTFHRAVERIEKKLDDNEQAQKRLQREQDGSEVKSVQLETLIGVGQSLIERRDSLELFRETAADIYLRTLGMPWSPRSGSRVNHRQMTAAMIDSRDFIAAKRRADRRRRGVETLRHLADDGRRILAIAVHELAVFVNPVINHGGQNLGRALAARDPRVSGVAVL